ncbi:MAG TPA: low temperature requirement protein A [Gaiellaceae bacterium]|nr:low temperature requirement protein A [Gaiellaceae bacterium]
MEVHDEHEQRVKPLELFFDLVFVFAITQVTSLLAADPTWHGLIRGLLVLAALWWAWAAYAWLTNTLDPEEGAVRIAMFAVTAAMLIVALAVPEAFDDHGVIFGVAYLFVRAMHLALYALAARGDHDLLGAVLRMTPSSTISGVLILAAGFLDDDQRVALWLIALAIDYLGVLVGRGMGWRMSPGHFAERHGLIVIIAIGESIVALGVGATGTPLSTGVIAAALVGIVIASALWWTYFDWVAIVVEQRLRQATGAAQATLARDAYSYIHFLMVSGIVLFAVSLKKALDDYDKHLETVPATALCGGLGLYLVAHVLLRYRISRSVGRGRLGALLATLAFWPFAPQVPAVAALAVVAAVFVLLIAYEALRYREPRAQLRHGAIATDEMMSAPRVARRPAS